MSKDDLPEKITTAIIKLLAEERKSQGLTYEDLANLAGVDRSTIALWERSERSPGFAVILKVCQALGVELPALIIHAEATVSGLPNRSMPIRAPRAFPDQHFLNEAAMVKLSGLNRSMLKRSIEHCYQTLDTIDFQLELHGSRAISRLVELANLSSMIGNILGEGIAINSAGLYARNTPHTYPDLVPQKSPAVPLEIKIALETNRPKGHLPKAGAYLTFRYVLCSRSGVFSRGKENRGDTVYIWEARVGKLGENDFQTSNTAGDSGKTAVIKSAVFDTMLLVYYHPELMPYGRSRLGYSI